MAHCLSHAYLHWCGAWRAFANTANRQWWAVPSRLIPTSSTGLGRARCQPAGNIMGCYSAPRALTRLSAMPACARRCYRSLLPLCHTHCSYGSHGCAWRKTTARMSPCAPTSPWFASVMSGSAGTHLSRRLQPPLLTLHRTCAPTTFYLLSPADYRFDALSAMHGSGDWNSVWVHCYSTTAFPTCTKMIPVTCIRYSSASRTQAVA